MLSCALLCRDDESTLEECLKSVRPHVDELVVIDTGSKDGSPEIARRYADVFDVYLECNNIESGLIDDFSKARNHSFEKASGDWIFWLDADDILQNGETLRELVAEAPEVDNVIYMAPYEYSFDENGICTTLHHRERLLRPRHQFVWQTPVHEGCLPRQPIEGTIVTIPTDKIRLIHQARHSTKVREQGRNLRILREWVSKNGEGDVRALYYLGLEFEYNNDVANALWWLRRYVELGTWTDEKCLAELEIAQIYLKVGDWREAERWAHIAMTTKSWPDAYWILCQVYYELAINGHQPDYNFRRCAHWARLGLKEAGDVSAESVLMRNPKAQWQVHEYLNVALSRIGEIDAAMESCRAGLSMMPNSKMLKTNLAAYENHKLRASVLEGIGGLEKAGEITKQAGVIMRATLSGDFKIQMLEGPAAEASADSIRDQLEDGDEEEPQEALTAPADGCLDIVLYVGHALEPWNPKTLQRTGMGGSETMAWEMARRLAGKGHRVRLFGHCGPTQEGVFEGVEWRDAAHYRNLTCDVLIASRRPDAVDDVHNVKAKCRLLWMHDIHCGEALNQVRDLRIDRILTLSNWHKGYVARCYPLVSKDKILVTRNGIDLTKFSSPPTERHPHRAIYSSSPDRGLQTALDCWPHVRDQIPDAELHVFYGFDNWLKSCDITGDEAQRRSIQYLQHLASITPGVIMRGRVNQDTLYREMMKSGVWAYPTWWLETSCITAMEVQAAGLYMVTSPIAALNETAGERAVMIGEGKPDEWRTPEYFEAWTAAVVKAMHHEYPLTRAALVQYAEEHFGLDELADEWDAMLRQVLKEVTESVVPKFKEVGP